jgi:hypothetical protein
VRITPSDGSDVKAFLGQPVHEEKQNQTQVEKKKENPAMYVCAP